LKKNVKYNEDFEILPPEAFRALQKWYGAQPDIERKVNIRSLSENEEEGRKEEGKIKEQTLGILNGQGKGRREGEEGRDGRHNAEMPPAPSSSSSPKTFFLRHLEEDQQKLIRGGNPSNNRNFPPFQLDLDLWPTVFYVASCDSKGFPLKPLNELFASPLLPMHMLLESLARKFRVSSDSLKLWHYGNQGSSSSSSSASSSSLFSFLFRENQRGPNVDCHLV